jgi:hypothetical protein
MARRLGLESVPPMSPSPELIEHWLMTYGPLWVNGKTHIVVIAGIDTLDSTVNVYDPWPVNAGRIDWRSLQTWYADRSSASSRDISDEVDAVFLYVPV